MLLCFTLQPQNHAAMMKRIPLLLLLLGSTMISKAQTKSTFIAGPMPGLTELRTAKIWCEVSPETDKVTITYRKAGETAGKTISYNGKLGQAFNPITFDLTGLDFNTTYNYEIEARVKQQSVKKTG